jgi:hypothetical protein
MPGRRGRPDLPHYGAGETVCKPTLAAVANAVFVATGVRLRRASGAGGAEGLSLGPIH